VYKGFIQRLLGGGDVRVHAVDGVTFSVNEGEVFGLVGESGCGKSTIARTLVGLARATGGAFRFRGEDVTNPDPVTLFRIREQIQMIHQDPHAALSPAMTVGQAISDVIRVHGIRSEPSGEAAATPEDVREAVHRVLEEVELRPPKFFYTKYPDELSGGQKQRVVVGRALALRPKVVVADEPLAMLDMSVRARMLEFLLDLKARFGLTYVFITHDLATAKFVCDRIAIMYLGRIVEMGPAKAIYADPKHPYTRALLAAIPVPDPTKREKKQLPRGEVPDAVHPPAGCRFHPRCPVALPTCGWEGRDLVTFLEERWLSPDLAAREAAAGPPEAWEADGSVVRRDVKRGDEGAVQGLVEGMLKEAGGAMAQAVQDIRAEDPPPPDWGPAILYGLLAAILGATLWGVIYGLWGYILGIVVAAVGVGVASAIRRGAHRVTPGIIGLGVVLTMFAAFFGDVIGLAIGAWRLGYAISVVDILAAYPRILAAAPAEAAVAYAFGFAGAFVAAYRLYRKMKGLRSVVVEFGPSDPLGPKEVDGRTVECLLY
jgi:peptide/nickel transport system ATP-binding protein